MFTQEQDLHEQQGGNGVDCIKKDLYKCAKLQKVK